MIFLCYILIVNVNMFQLISSTNKLVVTVLWCCCSIIVTRNVSAPADVPTPLLGNSTLRASRGGRRRARWGKRT